MRDYELHDYNLNKEDDLYLEYLEEDDRNEYEYKR